MRTFAKTSLLGNMRFIGTIHAKVDQKGRAFLPAVFRRVFSEGEEERLILRKDFFENCLVIYPEKVWNQRLDELHAKLSVWSREQQQMFRQFVRDVEWLTLDANGRFLIPKRYLKMAGITQEVEFIGMDETIEIWAKESLSITDDQETLNKQLEQIMTEHD